MTLASSIQNRIDSKIFTRLGSTATRSAYLSGSTDEWGDETPTYDTAESITVVPYSYIESRQEYQPFGSLNDGETMIALKYDQSLSINDKFIWDSKTWIVKEIEEFPLANENVLKVALLAESI